MWAFDLVKTTMKPLYDAAYGDDPDMEAEFGWKEKEKREEMWSDHAWYLLARYRSHSKTHLKNLLKGPRRVRRLLFRTSATIWTMMTRFLPTDTVFLRLAF